MTKLLALALAAGLAGGAQARELAGVQVPDTLQVGGQTLTLNGVGLRKKFIIKVYVGALYLPAPARDPAAIVAADEPKAVRMTFVHDVERSQIQYAFYDGFRSNGASPELLAKLKELAPALRDLKKGDVLQVSYVPGIGSIVGVEGGQPVTVAGKDFADALFRNWLGDKPADDDLKKGMLGG